jgi:hypothetical protein
MSDTNAQPLGARFPAAVYTEFTTAFTTLQGHARVYEAGTLNQRAYQNTQFKAGDDVSAIAVDKRGPEVVPEVITQDAEYDVESGYKDED